MNAQLHELRKTMAMIVAISAVISGCKEQTVDKRSEGEKLMQLSREWSQSVASRDTGKILSYWADDALLLSGGTNH